MIKVPVWKCAELVNLILYRFSNDPSIDYDMRVILEANDVRGIHGGSVSIETTNPGTFKLAVEGKIGAREIEVTTAPWADFVFLKDYRLRPLCEVEAFINENGHFTEIPSAKEMEENGINLGEMDAKLLQKIEELTLYMIEQEYKKFY